MSGSADAHEWVHLVPAGTFSGSDGRGPFRLADAPAVIAASLAGGKIPFDENHSTDLAAPRGAPSPARGWIVAMQSRPDGIWGRVEWTGEGRALLGQRAYRGVSPVFESDKSGTVLRVLRAALTNVPNLPQLATMHSRGNVTLSAEDRRICQIMGTDPAKFAEQRAWMARSGAVRATPQAANAPAGGVHAMTPEQIRVFRVMGIDPAKAAEQAQRMNARRAGSGDAR